MNLEHLKHAHRESLLETISDIYNMVEKKDTQRAYDTAETLRGELREFADVIGLELWEKDDEIL